MNSIELPLRDGDDKKGIKRRWIPADTIVRKLQEIRNNSELWKAGGASGADQYQGMPPFLRNIDEIISMLTKQ